MTSQSRQLLLFSILLGGALLPWLWQIAQMTTNLDTLWLAECMKRILAGGTMSSVAYDTNPPLSLLLYTGPVLLENMGLGLPLTTLLQSFLILGFSAYMLWRVSADFTGLNDGHRFALLAGFLSSHVILSGYYFGERDHLIGMVIVPLLLLQISLAQGLHRMTKTSWIFLVLAALMFLLKPHFGIVPLMFFAVVIFNRRDLSVIKSTDFITFALMTLLYTVVIAVFFVDYVTIILPDVIQYYSTFNMRPTMFGQYKFEIGVAVLLTALSFTVKSSDVKLIIRWLALGALLCYGAAILQNKGFTYHFMPALVLSASAACVLMFDLTIRKLKLPLAAGFVLLASLGGTWAYNVVKGQYFPGNYDPQSPVVQEIIKGTAGQTEKSFFLQTFGMGSLHEIAYYTGIKHASRFAVPWFMPGLVQAKRQNEQGLLTEESRIQFERDYDRFGSMIAADFDSYKPGVVILLSPTMARGMTTIPEVFGAHPEFQKAWSHYKFDHQFREPQFGSTLAPASLDRVYDVYMRMDQP